MKAGIEPLRAIWRTGLVQNTVYQFFIKYLGILGGREIPVTFAPYAPAIGQAMGYLFCGCFAAKRSIWLRYTGFAEIFLGQYVSSNLAPFLRYLYVGHFKHYFTARIADNRSTVVIFNLF